MGGPPRKLKPLTKRTMTLIDTTRLEEALKRVKAAKDRLNPLSCDGTLCEAQANLQEVTLEELPKLLHWVKRVKLAAEHADKVLGREREPQHGVGWDTR